MSKSDGFFWMFFLAVVGSFAWRYFRNGSLTGALLGGRISSTVGEVELQSPAMTSQVVKVHILEAGSEGAPRVALSIVSKAPLGARLVPIKLSQSQARELAALLEHAAA